MGKRPVLTPDEVLRLPIDEALIIIRGKKTLKVDKMDYSKHPEYPLLRSCKASAHIPEWRRLEMERVFQFHKFFFSCHMFTSIVLLFYITARKWAVP